MDLASRIDHTLLKPTASWEDVLQLCNEAVRYGFAAVCIPPPFVKRVKTVLAPGSVKVATVIGFPLGYSATEAKMAETILALVDGAEELDVVINLIALKMHDWEFVGREIRLLTDVVHQKGKTLKLIVESGLLTDEEIVQCCAMAASLHVDFLKTSTGYAEKGASPATVKLMRKHLPPEVKIKASGGIRDYELALALATAGADRIGSSSGVAIVRGAPGFREP